MRKSSLPEILPVTSGFGSSRAVVRPVALARRIVSAEVIGVIGGAKPGAGGGLGLSTCDCLFLHIRYPLFPSRHRLDCVELSVDAANGGKCKRRRIVRSSNVGCICCGSWQTLQDHMGEACFTALAPKPIATGLECGSHREGI